MQFGCGLGPDLKSTQNTPEPHWTPMRFAVWPEDLNRTWSRFGVWRKVPPNWTALNCSNPNPEVQSPSHTHPSLLLKLWLCPPTNIRHNTTTVPILSTAHTCDKGFALWVWLGGYLGRSMQIDCYVFLTILCLLDGLSLRPSSFTYLSSYHAQTMTHCCFLS
jgi:hypothetical protein